MTSRAIEEIASTVARLEELQSVANRDIGRIADALEDLALSIGKVTPPSARSLEALERLADRLVRDDGSLVSMADVSKAGSHA